MNRTTKGGKIVKSEGVLYVVAHLVITIAFIVVYAINLFYNGTSDRTLETILIAIVGYWFGALRPADGVRKDQKKEKEVA